MAAVHALALGGRLIRRFCHCALEQLCRCGLQPSRSGWSVAGLIELQQLMAEHGSVATAARLLNRTLQDCNIALDRLMGRTPAHALAALEAWAERRQREGRPAAPFSGQGGC